VLLSEIVSHILSNLGNVNPTILQNVTQHFSVIYTGNEKYIQHSNWKSTIHVRIPSVF
jgi:hypothetical protein